MAGSYGLTEELVAQHQARVKGMREVEPGVLGVRVDPSAPVMQKKRSRPVQHEENEQRALIDWAKFVTVGPWVLAELLMHPANGGARSKAEAGRFKSIGVQPGYPDLVLDVAAGPYHGARWEMKHGDNAASEAQGVWHVRLRELGYYVATCWTAKEAAGDIERYLLQQIRFPVVVRTRL